MSTEDLNSIPTSFFKNHIDLEDTKGSYIKSAVPNTRSNLVYRPESKYRPKTANTNLKFQEKLKEKRRKSKLVPNKPHMEKEKLYEENIALKQNLNSLIEEKTKFKTRYLRLEKEIKKKTESSPYSDHIVIGLKQSILELKQRLTEKDSELQTMKKNFKVTKLNEYEVEFKVLHDECIRLRVLLEENNKKAIKSESVSDLKSAKDSLSSKLIEQIQENNVLKSKIIDLEKREKSKVLTNRLPVNELNLQKELEEKSKENENLLKRLSEYEQKVLDLDRKLEEKELKIKKMNTEPKFEDIDQRFKEKINENERLEIRIKEYEMKVIDLNLKIDEKYKEKEELLNSIKGYNSKITDLGRQLKETNEEKEALQTSAKELEKKTADLARNLDARNKEKEDLITRLNESEQNTVKNLNRKLELVNEEKEALLGKIQSYELKVIDLNKELQSKQEKQGTENTKKGLELKTIDFNREIESLKEEKSGLSKKIQGYEQDILGLNRKLESQQKEQEELSNKIKGYEKDTVELNRKLEFQKEEEKKMLEKIKGHEQETQDFLKKLEQINKEKDLLLNKISEHELNIKILNQKLDEKKPDLERPNKNHFDLIPKFLKVLNKAQIKAGGIKPLLKMFKNDLVTADELLNFCKKLEPKTSKIMITEILGFIKKDKKISLSLLENVFNFFVYSESEEISEDEAEKIEFRVSTDFRLEIKPRQISSIKSVSLKKDPSGEILYSTKPENESKGSIKNPLGVKEEKKDLSNSPVKPGGVPDLNFTANTEAPTPSFSLPKDQSSKVVSQKPLENTTPRTATQDLLRHLVFRLQLNSIPSSSFIDYLFPTNRGEEIKAIDLEIRLQAPPINFSLLESKSVSAFIFNLPALSVKTLQSKLAEKLNNWEVRFDQIEDLKKFLEKNGKKIENLCREIDQLKKGKISIKEFEKMIEENAIEFPEGAKKLFYLKCYDHEFRLDEVPYLDVMDKVIKGERRKFPDEETRKIADYYLSKIARSLKYNKKEVSDVFGVDPKGLINDEEFLRGLSKLGFGDIEHDHKVALLDALEIGGNEVMINMRELREVLKYYDYSRIEEVSPILKSPSKISEFDSFDLDSRRQDTE